VTQMDQATQQNAALVEEMAAAASSLRTQAQELVQTVAVFRLDGHSGRIAPAALPAGVVPARVTPPPVAVGKPAMSAKASAPKLNVVAPTPAPTPKAGAGSDNDDWETF
jgi:methyl-accepting chemotaxis protein